jgi:hypothetical protein
MVLPLLWIVNVREGWENIYSWIIAIIGTFRHSAPCLVENQRSPEAAWEKQPWLRWKKAAQEKRPLGQSGSAGEAEDD